MKNRETFRYLAIAIAAAFVASASPVSLSYGASTTDIGTATPGTLVVGIDLTYPPYASVLDGKSVGFDVELATLIAQKLDVQKQEVDTRFEQIIAGLRSGRTDAIIASLYITGERAKVVDYVPYFQTGTSMIVAKDSDYRPQSLSDLCGKKIGSIKGAAILNPIRGEEAEKCQASSKEPPVTAEFASDPEATQALISGQIDVQLTDAAVAGGAVQKLNDRIALANGELFFPIAVGMAVKKGNSKLHEAITRALEELKADGSYQKLLDQYNLKVPDEALVAKSLGTGQ